MSEEQKEGKEPAGKVKPAGRLQKILGIENDKGPVVILAIAIGALLLFSAYFFLISLGSKCPDNELSCRYVSVYLTTLTLKPFVSLAGASLIAMYIIKKQDLLVGIFGVLIIGAVIVSVEDLMKFAVFVFERDNEELFLEQPQNNNAQQFQRANILAQGISDKLNKALGDEEAQQIFRTHNDQIVDSIAASLEEINRDNAIQQLRAEGVLALLKEVGKKGITQVFSVHGQRSDLLRDLQSLRDTRVVTYLYDDISSLQISREGCLLLRRDLRLNDPALNGADFYRVLVDNYPECGSLLAEETQGAQPNLNAPTNIDNRCRGINTNLNQIENYFQELSVSGFGTCLYFQTSIGGTYEIQAMSEYQDPYIELYASGVELPLASDDDSGDWLNASIVVNLDADLEYILNLRMFEESGSATASIERFDGSVQRFASIEDLTPSSCETNNFTPLEVNQPEFADFLFDSFTCRSLSIQSAGRYRFRAIGTGDPFVRLFDPEGVIIKDEDDSAGIDMNVEFVEPLEGAVYTMIIGNHLSGNIEIAVESEENDI